MSFISIFLLLMICLIGEFRMNFRIRVRCMFLQLWSRTVRKRLPKILHNGNLRSSPIIASVGRTVSRMRIMTKRCDRPKNAGPKKTTGSNRREDVLRRSAGPERLAPGILIFRAPKCMISVFPPLQKGAKDPFRPSRGSCRSRTPRGLRHTASQPRSPQA